ncbi:hypothetical protein [Hutsoniella sourekii]|uniref:hypothetical protein n=1 Tax=Hutsoniella sourekii TaxID=87650 RepID=UPI000488829F|nr:hypothetical protein [Hutsoniella sourekii]
MTLNRSGLVMPVVLIFFLISQLIYWSFLKLNQYYTYRQIHFQDYYQARIQVDLAQAYLEPNYPDQAHDYYQLQMAQVGQNLMDRQFPAKHFDCLLALEDLWVYREREGVRVFLILQERQLDGQAVDQTASRDLLDQCLADYLVAGYQETDHSFRLPAYRQRPQAFLPSPSRFHFQGGQVWIQGRGSQWVWRSQLESGFDTQQVFRPIDWGFELTYQLISLEPIDLTD